MVKCKCFPFNGKTALLRWHSGRKLNVLRNTYMIFTKILQKKPEKVCILITHAF